MLYESRHQKFLPSALPVKGAVSQHVPDPGQSYHIRKDSFVVARSSKHLITDGCCLFPAVGQQKASKSAAAGHRPQATLNTGCSSQAGAGSKDAPGHTESPGRLSHYHSCLARTRIDELQNLHQRIGPETGSDRALTEYQRPGIGQRVGGHPGSGQRPQLRGPPVSVLVCRSGGYGPAVQGH